MKRIPEDYLHYVWQYGLFDHIDLCTTDGEPIVIHHRGQHNHNAGPDFLHGRLSIGDQEWAGNVEIHFNSSDWKAHSHDVDEAYDNVILHVVMHHDYEVTNQQGAIIPTLSLSNRFNIGHFDSYRSLIENKNWIACAPQLSTIDPIKVTQMMDRAIIDRLEQKSRRLLDTLEICKGDWNSTLYTALAMAFGGKVNAEPFGLLSRLTPLEVIAHHNDDPFMLEALFIGQAGYLEEEYEDDYPNDLKQQYDFLRHKYRLQPMKKVSWKNSRIRPSSLPLIRIAQFSKVWQTRTSLFSFFLTEERKVLAKRLAISLDGYWKTHYGFDKKSEPRAKSVGESTINSILINTVVPLRFAHSIHLDDLNSKERALSLLEELPAEANAVIRNWQNLGVEVGNAWDSQALLQVKKHQCDEKKCLQCPIGLNLLRKDEQVVQ